MRYWYPICGGGGWCARDGEECRPEEVGPGYRYTNRHLNRTVMQSQCKYRRELHPVSGRVPSGLPSGHELRGVGYKEVG